MERQPGEVPRDRRIAVEHQAVLVRADGTMSSATVTDISKDGFRLIVADAPDIGEHVFLRVERYGDFPAQIRWVLGTEAGGVFLEPIELR
ncbi:MAG: PilZ domain-containing protein [Sphingomicrobium sp.]